MRYKVGWFIPHQVLALTHFVPEVSQDDFIGIVHETNRNLSTVEQAFHLLIDNRIIKSDQIASLELILQSMPQFQTVPLRCIVMVLPQHLRAQASTMKTQHIRETQLIYVESLAAGFATLKSLDASLNWELQTIDFFAPDL